MEFKIVDIDELVPNPFQPREEFDKESISELADSLKSVGEIQPIIVRKQKKGGYQIIAGERRWRAAKFARLTEVPVLIKDTAEENILLESLIENLHRLDLKSVERENAVYELWKTGRWKTQEELGKALGKARTWVVENVSAADIRKEEKIPAAVATRTITDTIGLEREERKQVLAKVEREELPAERVREYARVFKESSPVVKEAMLKPKARITPKVAEKLMEVQQEGKQKEIINYIQAQKMDEELSLKLIERTKEPESPILGVKRVDEVEDILDGLETFREFIMGWGINQYMILSKANKWNDALQILDKIERKIQELRTTRYA